MSAGERRAGRQLSWAADVFVPVAQQLDVILAERPDSDPSLMIPAQHEIVTAIQEIIRVEMRHLQAKVQAELKEVRILLAARPAPAPRACASPPSAMPSEDAMQSHAWVSRSMRGYAMANEISDMVDTMSSSASNRTAHNGPELLPNNIVKGSGPLARARRRRERRRQVDAIRSDCQSEGVDEDASEGGATVKHAWLDRPGRGQHRATSYTSSLSSGSSFMPVRVLSTGRSSSKTAVTSDSHHGHNEHLDPIAPSFEVPPPVAPSPTNVSGVNVGTMPTIHSVAFSSTLWSNSKVSDRRVSLRTLALMLVRSPPFENLTVCCIATSTIMIGVQTDYCARNLVENGPSDFQTVGLVTAGFFAFELALRLFAFRRAFFTMPSWKWNVFDLVLVLLQLMEEIMTQSATAQTNMPIAISLMRLLRVLRLIRVIRVVRLLRYMSELRTIVVSMTSSLRPLLSTIVLLALVVYVAGVYFTQISLTYRIDHEGTPEAKELEAYFGSLGGAVMALFQTVTGGCEWRHLVGPLMQHISPAMGIFFALYVVFTSMALMNIVTGVFVETALQRGREDKDVYMINHLKELFGVLDENCNGMISWAEVEVHLDDSKLKAFLRDIDIDVSEARGLFLLLDRDGSGTIDADEFLCGCLRLRGPAKALDMQLVMRELADQRKAVTALLGGLEHYPVGIAEGPGGDSDA